MSARSVQPDPAPPPAGPTGAAAVLADLEAGHEPLTLKRATKERCLWTRGRAPHVGMLYRAIQATNAHPLETAVLGVRVTTRPALMRWLARNNQGGRPDVAKPEDDEQRRERTEARLDAFGIR